MASAIIEARCDLVTLQDGSQAVKLTFQAGPAEFIVNFYASSAEALAKQIAMVARKARKPGGLVLPN